MMEVLAEKLAIRELVERSCAAVISKDPDLWLAAWAPNGRWKLPSMDEAVVGRDNLVASFIEKMDYVERMHMSAFPEKIEISGNKADGIFCCKEEIYTKSGDVKNIIGRYHDEYIKLNGIWMFLCRSYEVVFVK